PLLRSVATHSAGQDGQEAGDRGSPDGEPCDVFPDDTVVEQLELLDGTACGHVHDATDGTGNAVAVQTQPGEHYGEKRRRPAVGVRTRTGVLVDSRKQRRRRPMQR